MGLVAKDKGGTDIPPCPTGMHHAICYGIVDIGTQPAFGKFPARRKVVILFEFPELRIELPDKQDPKKKLNLPRALSVKETLTLASKGNLRPLLEGWRGRPFTPEELDGFDLKKVLGANALLNVIHTTSTDGKVWANIATVNPLATGMKKRTGEIPPMFFSFDDVGPNVAKLDFSPHMPQWVIGLISQSDEYTKRFGKGHQPHQEEERLPTEEDSGDVPF